jgi:hypothetical protein
MEMFSKVGNLATAAITLYVKRTQPKPQNDAQALRLVSEIQDVVRLFGTRIGKDLSEVYDTAVREAIYASLES